MKQCQSCGGTYLEIGADGVRYFHACAPLSTAEIAARIATGHSPLTPAQQQQFAAAQAIAAPLNPPANYIAPADAYLASLTIERPNKRDENIDRAKLAAAPRDEFGNVRKSVTADQLMKSVGLGAVDVVTPLV